MRFGGHETFAVREGWLSKGLSLIKNDPRAFEDPFVSDSLGVGRNMAKSIRHWLMVTGLVRKGKDRSLSITDTGEVVFKHDPYLLSVGTWWALHVNLVTCREDAVVWRVFFDTFPHERFDRIGCVEEMRRQLALDGQRLPSEKTLLRDVACMLSSYATVLPPEDVDPEEGRESPFRSLGLVTELRETGTYRLNRSRKDVPLAVLGYALSVMPADEAAEDFVDIGFSEAFAKPGSAGKTLCLDLETFSDLLDKSEKSFGSELIHVRQLGGERFIRVRHISGSDWLTKYYAESGKH
ncbi:MAG: DUF4007 family protein [Candidatus Dadabacteria bacterium]|nr:DUF4007 family protein [Candidatus Dadabacteria bacterium]